MREQMKSMLDADEARIRADERARCAEIVRERMEELRLCATTSEDWSEVWELENVEAAIRAAKEAK